VARYLKSRGIPAKLIESRYFGETHPHAAGRDAAARADNRRVTVWLAGR
jgi:outer membrane protein OmpA-like peptidoglycan-associated protein